MALESIAERLGADYGRMAGGGELLEYTVPRRRGAPAVDVAGEALDRLAGVRRPSGAFFSARVNIAAHPDDEANYKTLNGFSMVPTAPYENEAAFGTGLMRLADLVDAKQDVLSITIRIGIPPKGFLAIHGDGLIAGPRTALVGKNVYQEGVRGGAKKVTAHKRSWLAKASPKRHPRSWLK